MLSINFTTLDPQAHLSELDVRAKNQRLPTNPANQNFANLFAVALSSSDTSPDASPGPTSPNRYVVQPGDNLWKISQQLGLDDPAALAQINNLANPDQLAVGQVLKLPAGQSGNPRPASTATRSSPATATQTSTQATGAPAGQYIVQPGDNLWKISQQLGLDDPAALARVNNLANPDQLTVGQVLKLAGGQPENPRPTTASSRVSGGAAAAPVARVSTKSGGRLVVASWYGDYHHGRRMANGKVFNMFADTVAHKSLPFGTRLSLTNPQNGQNVVATVTDRGPYIPGRTLDVSYGAARKLGMVETGVARLMMEKYNHS